MEFCPLHPSDLRSLRKWVALERPRVTHGTRLDVTESSGCGHVYLGRPHAPVVAALCRLPFPPEKCLRSSVTESCQSRSASYGLRCVRVAHGRLRDAH